MIKFIRFKKGIEIFDTQKVMEIVKTSQMNRLQTLVDTNDPRATDRLSDLTHIGDILLLSYALQTAK